jgi:hypothetical protein
VNFDQVTHSFYFQVNKIGEQNYDEIDPFGMWSSTDGLTRSVCFQVSKIDEQNYLEVYSWAFDLRSTD